MFILQFWVWDLITCISLAIEPLNDENIVENFDITIHLNPCGV